MNCAKCIILTMIMTSCGIVSDKSHNDASKSSALVIDTLLEKLHEIAADTLEVYSTNETENATFPFHGFKLDSLEIGTLPKKMRERFLYDPDFYGCYKLRIDSSHIGLIVRTPSEYVTSSIKLFVLDTSNKVILDTYVELAESIGDAGYLMTKRTFVFNDGFRLNYLIWKQESEDMSIEDESDTTVRTSHTLNLLTFRKNTFETLDNKTAKLLTMYRQLSKDYCNACR
jgi:hypothetical protein